MCHLGFGSIGYIFPHEFEIFLVLSMPSNFGLCFEHYVIKLSVFFKCCVDCWYFCSSRQLSLVHGSNQLSVGCSFNLSSVFKSFAVLFGFFSYEHYPVANLWPVRGFILYFSVQSLWYAAMVKFIHVKLRVS